MRRSDLVPDCGSCAAICCVATSFERSDLFGFDKAAGVPCSHLLSDCRCGIHEQRVARGFSGCAGYDCYGAGQRVTRAFAGSGASEQRRNEAFLILRVVHELLWLLTEASKLCPASQDALAAEMQAAITGLDAIARGPCLEIDGDDWAQLRARAHALLRRVGAALGGRGAKRGLLVID